LGQDIANGLSLAFFAESCCRNFVENYTLFLFALPGLGQEIAKKNQNFNYALEIAAQKIW